jgi:hypothetical protein
MKKALGCSAQIVLLLVAAALIAVPLACIATATAPMHSPQLVEQYLCPANTHLEADWYRASWNHPGEKTLSVTCVDAQGKIFSTRPQDAEFWLGGTWIYFPYVFIPMLVLGAILLAVLNALGFALGAFWKRVRAPKPSPYNP